MSSPYSASAQYCLASSYIFHNQPPPPLPSQNHSRFHSFTSQPMQPTAFHIYNHLLTAKHPTHQLHLLFTNLIYRLQTTQPPVKAPPPTHNSPETLAKIRKLCTLLQEPNPARSADAISIQLEHLHQLHEDNYVLKQKLTLYRQLVLTNCNR